MRDRWVHVGRLWTNGDPFLAVDAALRHAWHGYSNDDYDQVIPLGWQDTSVPVGVGRAVLVGADGVVRDDSWIEVFATDTGLVAIVQASGPDYPDVLAKALGYPDTDDQDGDALKVGSGELAIFSAAIDGTGPYSGPFVNARPGPVPPMALLLGDLPGVEQVKLDFPGDVGDAGLAGLAGGEVAGFLGLAGAGPVRAVADEGGGGEDLQQEGGEREIGVLRGKKPRRCPSRRPGRAGS